MKRYEVRVARRAIKAIERLERRDQQRVRAAIDLLADEPRPPGCVALAGEDGVYRVRIGSYRILYEVIDAQLLVLVVRVGHRRAVYRN